MFLEVANSVINYGNWFENSLTFCLAIFSITNKNDEKMTTKDKYFSFKNI